MKIALAQFNPTVGDFAGNSARILELAHDAKRSGAHLAVFSELCLCGYLPQDLLERPAFIERNRTELACLAKKVPLPVIVGYAGRSQDPTGKPLANIAALVAEGRILFEQHKMLLPTYDVFDEDRYFQPAKSQRVFPLCGEQLGITICEDVWNDKNFWAKRLYDRDPVAELVGQGTTVLLNLSASPYTIDKRNLRLGILQLACYSMAAASPSPPMAALPLERAHLKKTLSCSIPPQQRETFTRRPTTNSNMPISPWFAARAITSANAVSARCWWD